MLQRLACSFYFVLLLFTFQVENKKYYIVSFRNIIAIVTISILLIQCSISNAGPGPADADSRIEVNPKKVSC